VKHFLLALSSLLFYFPLFGQSDKPQTIIIPTGSVGKMTKSRIKILEKTLESKLGEYFAIVTKEVFDEAKETAFDELEFEECNDDQCILKIQEILQVKNAFKMELITEEGDTQISITWNDLEQKRVEENYCTNCSTKQLRNMIGGLVDKLFEAKYPNDKGITGEGKKQTDSAIKETFPFGYTLSLEYDSISTSINKLVPSLSASNEIAVSWGLLGVGLGFGEEEYIGFRYLSGSGKTDSFYFSSGDLTGYANSVSVQVAGIYYAPSYKEGLIYGIGIENWQLTIGTTLGEQTIRNNVPLVDGGYQFFVKGYPLNIKVRWSTFGIVYNFNLGWEFSVN